jgi:hypothetical protein
MPSFQGFQVGYLFVYSMDIHEAELFQLVYMCIHLNTRSTMVCQIYALEHLGRDTFTLRMEWLLKKLLWTNNHQLLSPPMSLLVGLPLSRVALSSINIFTNLIGHKLLQGYSHEYFVLCLYIRWCIWWYMAWVYMTGPTYFNCQFHKLIINTFGMNGWKYIHTYIHIYVYFKMLVPLPLGIPMSFLVILLFQSCKQGHRVINHFFFI